MADKKIEIPKVKLEESKPETEKKHVDYRLVQLDICDIGGEGDVSRVEDPEYCPTCIIDENAQKRNWWTEPLPYLDGQTCEYHIPVTLNADGKSFNTRELRDVKIPFNVFKYSYLRTGIRTALKHFDKIRNDQIVCAMIPQADLPTAHLKGKKYRSPKKQLYKQRKMWKHLGKFYRDRTLTDRNGHQFKVQEVDISLVNQFDEITNHDALELYSYIKDYHLGNGLEPIKMLVAIPAYVFDQIPTDPATMLGQKDEEEDDEETENVDFVLKTEVELDGKKFKQNLVLLEKAFGVWEKYQAMFYNVNGGRIKELDPLGQKKPKNWYMKSHTKQIDDIKNAFDNLLDANGYELHNNRKKDGAEKIKITFALPTATKPYRIEKIEAKYEKCDYQPCSLGFETFKAQLATKNETVLNYVAYLDEAMPFITEMEETPYLDWLQQYNYPPLQIQFGDDENASDVPCVDITRNPDEVDDALFALDLDWGKMLEWLMAQFNCKTLKDLKDYDPFKEIGDLQNKLKKMLEGFTFGDNDALNDLFGLPLDLKSMRGKKPMDLLNEIWERLTICNLASLLLEILKCLFGGFSLEELIQMLIKKIIMAAGIPLFEFLFNSLDSLQTVEGISLMTAVEERAPMRLGGFDTKPWDYYDQIKKEADSPGDYWEWTAGAGKKAHNQAPVRSDASALNQMTPALASVASDFDSAYGDALPGLTASGWLYSKEQMNVQSAEQQGPLDPGTDDLAKPSLWKVFTTWVDEMLDAMTDFEEILRLLEDFPGGKLLKIALALFACPYQNLLSQLFADLKNMLNLGALLKPCALGEPVFRLPRLPLPLPRMFWKDILKILLNMLIKLLIELIAMLLLMILMKILMALTCQGLKALLDFLKNGFDFGNDSLGKAITETLCGDDPNATDGDDDGDDADTDLDTLLGVMDNAGVVGAPEDIKALAADLSGGVPANAFKEAFINPPELQDPDLMAQIADIVTTRHPQFADVLGDPKDVGMFFSGIGNLLNDQQRAAVEASLALDDDVIDGPIDGSICLTNEQKEEWDAGRRAFISELCGDMPLDGFRPGEDPEPLEDDLWPYPDDKAEPTLADDWLGKLNDRNKDTLDEMLDLFLNGPAAALGDMLDEALKPGKQNCAFDPETGEPIEPGDDDYAAGKSIIPPMPVELSDQIDDAKRAMLEAADQRFVNDLQGKYHSFFNHLFADTYNAPFYRGSRSRPSHNTLVKSHWRAPNAADTTAQWQGKWDTVKDRFVIPKWFMAMNAPRDEDFKPNTDGVFATNVYPKTVGLWMRQQLLEEAEGLEFKTDMGLANSKTTYNVTRDYTRRRWSMDKKAVTFKSVDYATPNDELTLRFRDNNNGKGNGWNYGFDLKLVNYLYDENGNQSKEPGYRIILDELESTNIPSSMTFSSRYGKPVIAPATVKVSRDTYFEVSVPANPGNASNLVSIYSGPVTGRELKKYNVGGAVFKNYVKNIYNRFGVNTTMDDDLLAKTIFDQLNNFVYSNVIESLMNNPNGRSFTLPSYTTVDSDGEELVVPAESLSSVPEAFMFGYVNDNLTKADLTYVTPDATSDEDTWEYNHRNKEKVLGKSATGNPRVEFLDPEIHDMGKYTKPKIYISPPKYTGWLALNQLFIPEEDNHEPARKTFLFIDDLIQKDKDLREEIPMDERLNDPHKCTQEGPYDVFSDPTGHAGTHVAVLAMCRVYAFEHMLKTMGMYQILKPDYKNNYDESVLAAIVEDMEEDLKDLPRRRSKRGFFRGYSFWLLFLEQAVQTVERMIIVDDLAPTPEITEALDVIKETREALPPLTKKWIRLLKHVRTITWDSAGNISNINFAYSRRINGEKKYYPLDYQLADEDQRVLYSYLDSVMFYSLGRNFRSILSGETRNFAMRMRRRQRRMFKMASKLYAVHNTKDTAKRLLKHIVGDQLNFYGAKLAEIADDKERAGPKPEYHIENLRKYFFGSSDILLTGMNGGLRDEEEAFHQKVKDAAENEEEAPVYDYGGDLFHVIKDPNVDNPTNHFSSAQVNKLKDSPAGNFYIEKYLRIVDKPDDHASETTWYLQNQKSIVQSRDDLLKGVVNIKEFQKWMKQNLTDLSALATDMRMVDGAEEPYNYKTKISNIFGDMDPVYEELLDEEGNPVEDAPDPKLLGYNGSTGIRFGLRLCYIPPSDFKPSISLNDAKREKSFRFADPTGDFPDHNTKKIFPIVSYEKDISDVPIIELDLNDDNFGEDINCYIEQLINSEEMDLIFNYCAPIKRASSLMAVYSNYAFVPSVAEHPFERDNDNGQRPTEYWKSVILSQTKNSLRRLFIAHYSSVLFLSEKVGSRRNGRRWNPFKAWKNLFKILINPFAFLSGLAAKWGGFRKARRIVDRPYDMYGDPEGADDGVE